MTRQEHRQLDALVAEKVFGHKVYVESLPAYSIDIVVAWRVVEKLAETWDVTVSFSHDPTFRWECEVVRYPWEHAPDGGWMVTGKDTAPLAICLAALKAVGVEVPA